jgi:hypothetical protein
MSISCLFNMPSGHSSRDWLLLPSGLQPIQSFSHCIAVGHHTLHLGVSHSRLLPLPWLWHLVLLTTTGLLVSISKAELHLFKR